VKPACGFCGGPDSARMIRRPYGTVCLSCARYIDCRGYPASSAIPRALRRAVIDMFTWGALRAALDDPEYTDTGTDPFDFDLR
jgi:hypothetical protein